MSDYDYGRAGYATQYMQVGTSRLHRALNLVATLARRPGNCPACGADLTKRGPNRVVYVGVDGVRCSACGTGQSPAKRGVRHGLTGYTKCGCRCVVCREAKSKASMREARRYAQEET